MNSATFAHTPTSPPVVRLRTGRLLTINWDRYNGSDSDFDTVAAELLSFVRLDVRNRILRRYGLGLPLLWMHIHVRPRDVQVATEQKLSSGGLRFFDVLLEGFQESHFGRKVFPAIGHIDGNHGQISDLHRHDPILVVKRRMAKLGLLGAQIFPNVQANAGISAAAMPIAPVALHFADRNWHLTRRGLEFLKANKLGALALDPFAHLRLPRANAIHVPSAHFHRLADFLPVTGQRGHRLLDPIRETFGSDL
jgi:hypothetical protein